MIVEIVQGITERSIRTTLEDVKKNGQGSRIGAYFMALGLGLSMMVIRIAQFSYVNYLIHLNICKLLTHF